MGWASWFGSKRYGYTWQFNRAEEIGGLREDLALVNTAPRKRNGQLETTQSVDSGGGIGDGVHVELRHHDALATAAGPSLPGRAGLSGIAGGPGAVQPLPCLGGSTPDTTPFGYKYVPFRLAWDDGGKEKISLGWVVDQPTSLPDDRRDQTRIEVAP